MRAVVRVFSYLFHGLLTLFLLAIAAMALSSGQILHLDMLPWHGQSLSYWLLFSALAGLVSLILAILRTWRTLFLLWSLAAYLGHAIDVDAFLEADRRRDPARRAQRDYRRTH